MTMKKIKFVLLLALTQGVAMQAQAAKGFAMGYGGNTCASVIEVVNSGDGEQIGQVAGWILGYWTAISFQSDQVFVDKLKQAGPNKIVEVTLQQCEKADPNTPLVAVTHQTIQSVMQSGN